ncbi:unnamed protein product [Symbiodinium sp. KB8]|nr:unnamed protein product [Symbiodinium sp. KB8]
MRTLSPETAKCFEDESDSDDESDNAAEKSGRPLQWLDLCTLVVTIVILIAIALGFFGCLDLSHRVAVSGERTVSLSNFTSEALNALKHALRASAGDVRHQLPREIDNMIDGCEVIETKARDLVQLAQSGQILQGTAQGVYKKLMLMLYVASRILLDVEERIKSMPWQKISKYLASATSSMRRFEAGAQLLAPHLPARTQEAVYRLTNATDQLEGITQQMQSALQMLRRMDDMCETFTGNVSELVAKTMSPNAQAKVDSLMKSHDPFSLLHDEAMPELSQLLDDGVVKGFNELTSSTQSAAKLLFTNVNHITRMLSEKLHSLKGGTVAQISISVTEAAVDTKGEFEFLEVGVRKVGRTTKESLDELAWVYTILGVVMMVCVLVVLALVLAYLFMLQHDQAANSSLLGSAPEGWKRHALRAAQCCARCCSALAMEILLDGLAILLFLLALSFSMLCGFHLAVYTACQGNAALLHNSACTEAVEEFSEALENSDFFAGHNCAGDGILLCRDVSVSSTKWPVLVMFIPMAVSLLTCVLSRQVARLSYKAHVEAEAAMSGV